MANAFKVVRNRNGCTLRINLNLEPITVNLLQTSYVTGVVVGRATELNR